jgi:outer membrane protein
MFFWQNILTCGRVYCKPKAVNGERALLRKTVIVTAIFGVIFVLASGCPRAANLQDMAQAAQKHDALFLSSKAEYESAIHHLQAAFSGILPALDLSGQWLYNHLLVTYDNQRFTKINRDFETARWTASITQPIINIGAWADLTRAHIENDYAKAQFLRAELELYFRVTEAYYGVLDARENLAYLIAEQNNLGNRLAIIEGLHQSGVVAGTEALKVKTELAKLKAEVYEGEWMLANKRRRLVTIAGQDSGDPESVGEDAMNQTPLSLKDWIELGQQNPAIRSARLTVEIARQEANKVSAPLWPRIDAVGSYGDALEGPSASLPVDTYNQTYSAGIRCTWPLFSSIGALGEAAATRRKVERLLWELKAQEQENALKITEIYSGLDIGAKQLAALDQGITTGEKIVEATEAGYKAGAHRLMELLEARRQLLATKRERNTLFYQLLIKQTQLWLTVGKIPGES